MHQCSRKWKTVCDGFAISQEKKNKVKKQANKKQQRKPCLLSLNFYIVLD